MPHLNNQHLSVTPQHIVGLYMSLIVVYMCFYCIYVCLNDLAPICWLDCYSWADCKSLVILKVHLNAASAQTCCRTAGATSLAGLHVYCCSVVLCDLTGRATKRGHFSSPNVGLVSMLSAMRRQRLVCGCNGDIIWLNFVLGINDVDRGMFFVFCFFMMLKLTPHPVAKKVWKNAVKPWKALYYLDLWATCDAEGHLQCDHRGRAHPS